MNILRKFRASPSDFICQLNIMFLMEQDDGIPIETCFNNDYSGVIDRYV